MKEDDSSIRSPCGGRADGRRTWTSDNDTVAVLHLKRRRREMIKNKIGAVDFRKILKPYRFLYRSVMREVRTRSGTCILKL